MIWKLCRVLRGMEYRLGEPPPPPVIAEAMEQLREHEGLRLKPYTDTTGHTTIGYGRNLDARGISKEQAEAWLEEDVNETHRRLVNRWPDFETLPQRAQAALLNMAYNVGVEGLMTFEKMLAALKARDFLRASTEAWESKWRRQVGRRRALPIMREFESCDGL